MPPKKDAKKEVILARCRLKLSPTTQAYPNAMFSSSSPSPSGQTHLSHLNSQSCSNGSEPFPTSSNGMKLHCSKAGRNSRVREC